jgi:hypothetical protein
VRPKLPTHLDELTDKQFVDVIRVLIGLDRLPKNGRYFRYYGKLKRKTKKSTIGQAPLR